MRKAVLVLCLVFLCAASSLAQKKNNSGWACGKAVTANSIDVGDKPNHSYTIAQFKCTATKGEFEGVKEKEGTATEFDEVTGDGVKGHGIFVDTLANGDKITFAYQSTASMKDGQMQTGSNKWQATSGTGKFKDIKANGACKATGSPDGGIVFDCSGTYTPPK